MPLKNTIESRMANRIKRSADCVFLRQDFRDIGGYHQVGRVLQQLVKKGVLMKIGYGIYARAHISLYTGNTVSEKCLPELAEDALRKLGFSTYPSKGDRDYNSGKSTQVPTGRMIGVDRKISRKIEYNGVSVYFEQVS